MRAYCVSPETLLNAVWWPKWEGNPKKRRYMYTYGWFQFAAQQKLIQHRKTNINEVPQACLTLCNPVDCSLPTKKKKKKKNKTFPQIMQQVTERKRLQTHIFPTISCWVFTALLNHQLIFPHNASLMCPKGKGGGHLKPTDRKNVLQNGRNRRKLWKIT